MPKTDYLHAVTTVAVLPDCNLCESGQPASYDAKTTLGHGYWAYLCEKHFADHGVGLGLGRGQKLVVGE